MAECRQALIIGLDRSGSVDAEEERLMVEGLARALEDDEVQNAFLALPGIPVDLSIFEWSGARYQRLILDWAPMSGHEDLDGVARRLRTMSPVDAGTETAIGSAMNYAEAKLSDRLDCAKLTLDLAGDGKSNAGPEPDAVPFRPGDRDATVNALVIGLRETDGGNPGIAELTSYFRVHVIRGPGSFVEAALGFDDFGEAMKRKLKRELAVNLSEVGPRIETPDERGLPGQERLALQTAAENGP
jgi:hypothetical protein